MTERCEGVRITTETCNKDVIMHLWMIEERNIYMKKKKKRKQNC